MAATAQYGSGLQPQPSPEPITLALLGNTTLRRAIARNLVTFPSQVFPFVRKSSRDLHCRIVVLFFVRGWSVRSICGRYGLSKAMTHKLLAEWRIRAVESGYIQEVQPGDLDKLGYSEIAAQEDGETAPAAVRRSAVVLFPAGEAMLAGSLSAPLPPPGTSAELFAGLSR